MRQNHPGKQAISLKAALSGQSGSKGQASRIEPIRHVIRRSDDRMVADWCGGRKTGRLRDCSKEWAIAGIRDFEYARYVTKAVSRIAL